MATQFIEVVGLEEYNPRIDRKKHSWFRIDNDIAHSYKLSKLTPDQKWFYVCVIGFANSSNSKRVPLDLGWLHKETGVARKAIEGAIKILCDNSLLTLTGNRLVTDREPLVTERGPTDRQTDITDRQTETADAEPATAAESDELGLTPKILAQAWNTAISNVRDTGHGSMSLVDLTKFKSGLRRWKTAQARIAEEPDLGYWLKLIDKVAASEFLRGRNERGWVCTFDWILKPDNALKIMEGQYDRKPGGAKFSKERAAIVYAPAEKVFAEAEAGKEPERPLTDEEKKEMKAKLQRLGLRSMPALGGKQ
jgi:hypothetical protein